MLANGARTCSDDKNILKQIVLMVARLCEYIEDL